MDDSAVLLVETRGELLDLTHRGYIAAVDERGEVIWSQGDPNVMVFYRSASKPIQALPVIARGLDRAFGLTEEESTIFGGSHWGEDCHLKALASIFDKAGLNEDDMVMLPALPGGAAAREAYLRADRPPRRFCHNCAGKHAALMMLQRALTGSVRDYEKLDSPAQREVMRAVSCLSETDRIATGIDGCGVPVFAVPLKQIATAFKNLAAPERIADEALARAAASFVPRMAAHPRMVQGAGSLCEALNDDGNIVAKGGANGLYAFGLKKEKIGFAVKVADGSNAYHPLIVRAALRRFGALSGKTAARLDAMRRDDIVNDCGEVVGRREAIFGAQV